MNERKNNLKPADDTVEQMVRRISDRRCLRMTDDYIRGRNRGLLRDWPDVAMFWRQKWINSCREEQKTFIEFSVAITALREIAALPRGGRAKRKAIGYLDRLGVSYGEPNNTVTGSEAGSK